MCLIRPRKCHNLSTGQGDAAVVGNVPSSITCIWRWHHDAAFVMGLWPLARSYDECLASELGIRRTWAFVRPAHIHFITAAFDRPLLALLDSVLSRTSWGPFVITPPDARRSRPIPAACLENRQTRRLHSTLLPPFDSLSPDSGL
jgi:hypothetical protein